MSQRVRRRGVLVFSTIRSQHLTASLGAAAATILASLVGILALDGLAGRLLDITERSWPTANLCMEYWIGSLARHRAGYRLLRGDLVEGRRERAWADDFVAGGLAGLERSGGLPESALAELHRLDADARRALDELEAEAALGPPRASAGRIEEAMHGLDRVVARTEAAIAPIEDAMDRSMAGAAASGLGVARRARSLLWLVAAVALAGALLISHAIASRLVRPLHRLTEMTRRLASGETVEAVATERSDEVGELTGSFDRMAADLAASRRRLVDSEARYRALFEHAGHGMVVLDDAGTIIEANTAFARMAGRPREALSGARLRELLPEEAREGLARLLEALADGSHHLVEMELMRGGGGRVPGEGGAVRLADGRIVLSLRDVTQRRRMEQALVQGEKLGAIGQLAAGVAHELRNPLFVISNVLYDLRDTLGREHPAVAEDLRMAAEENRRARDIIDNLLAFSRPVEPDAPDVDLAAVIDQVLRLFREALLERDIQLDLRVASAPRCRFHPDAFKQVLVNLLSNAMDAMPGGGRLTITAGPAARGRVEVRVEDTGVGIPPERQGEIFNPFYSTKPPGRGTGLGLWIVHTTVQRYRGRVLVRSEPGRGTAFTLDLCAAAEAA